MKRGHPLRHTRLERKTPLRARRVPKAETGDRGSSPEGGPPARRKGKGASPSGDASASLAKPAFPKPTKAKGTSYSRRPREFGRMMFVRTLRCDGDYFPSHVCEGETEADHLRDHTGTGRREPDDTVTPKCRRLHREWTDHNGVFARWTPGMRLDFAEACMASAREAWDALGPVEQTHWDILAEANRKAFLASRRAA